MQHGDKSRGNGRGRAGVCRRCDAVGAVKTAEVHGARAEFCCRSGAVGAMKAAEVHGARAESLP